jgi:FHA domain/Protein of unknown function (DUF3662)
VSFFAKIEQLCASLIERTFAKTFPSDLEPAQIARKLVATMEAQTRDEEGQLRAPGSYGVFVNPADFARLAEHQSYLERAWTELVRDLAAKVGITLEDETRVVMASRESVPVGAIEIEVAGTPLRRGFRLRTVEGVPPGGIYSIDGTCRIGRSEESEIVLLDPSVSRQHAIVEVAGGAAMVRDVGSTNGTYLNGQRVEAQRLRDGDELRFGNTRMKFEAR